MAEKAETTAVIDIGSSFIKCGLQGDDSPREIIPTVVGTPASLTAHIPGQDDSLESAVGNKVLESAGLLRIDNPVKRGQCESKKDQENLGKILNQIHEEALAVSTDETNFMLTVPTLASWNHLKALTSYYMEESKAPSICYHNQGVLSMMGLYARTTGIFCDIGHGVTQVAPIFNGYGLPCAAQRSHLGGADLDAYFRRLLFKEGRGFETSAELITVRKIKENGISCSDVPFATGSKMPEPTKVKLPDGSSVELDMTLTASQMMCSEVLFNPELVGRQMPGIHETIYSAIQACPMDIRRELFTDIHISGGTSMIDGLGSRLQSELTKLAPYCKELKVVEKETRQNAVFLGAAAMAEVGEYDDNFWITSKEFAEHGANIVYRKGRGLF